MPQTEQVGSHVTWFEEPDVIALHLKGPVSVQESEALAWLHAEMARNRESVFMLVDMGEFEGGTPEGRRITSEALTRMPVRGVAIHSAKLTAKVMAKLVIAGSKLFRKEQGFPIEFFDHETAARDWIGSRRMARVS